MLFTFFNNGMTAANFHWDETLRSRNDRLNKICKGLQTDSDVYFNILLLILSAPEALFNFKDFKTSRIYSYKNTIKRIYTQALAVECLKWRFTQRNGKSGQSDFLSPISDIEQK